MCIRDRAYCPKDNSAEFDNDDTIVDWLTQYSPEKDVTYVRGFLGRDVYKRQVPRLLRIMVLCIQMSSLSR